MPIQYSVAVRNAQLNAVETTAGASAIMRIYSGAMPANVAATRTGTILATLNLPADWMANASGGTKVKSGTWEDASADATGTAGYFTIFASDGVTPHIQGNVGLVASNPVMVVDSVQFTAGQRFTVTTFTLQAGNA